MSRFRHKQNEQSHPGYATHSDFCKNLEDDLQPLYLLAFLLTGSHADAEQCFVATVEDAVRENCVFKGWERVWIRRCLVINAIRLIFSEPARSSAKPDCWGGFDAEPQGHSAVDAVAKLDPPLQRFVFVMSVLEKYSARESALLLGCTSEDVVEARIQALMQLPGFNPTVTKTEKNGTHGY
jgi:DNA-directed RNA polymerase specialized sigma24 family protein